MKSKVLLVIFMFFTSAFGHAEILKVDAMKELFSHFKHADQKTLALFDVDMVLLQPKDPAFQLKNMKRFRSIVKKILEEVPKEKQMLFLSWITVRSDMMLVDPEIPLYLQQLMDQDVPVMALTANLTGELGRISNMEKWRVENLRSLGIDFSKAAPYSIPLQFNDLPTYRGYYCSYLEGVLFSNGSNVTKGDLLCSFFEKSGFIPEKVIFVDDREENLRDVEMALLNRNSSTEFLGIHFLGAEQFPSSELSEEEFTASWTRLLKEVSQIN